MKIYLKNVVTAGVVGTGAITLVATFGAPMMGFPKMDIPGMLSSVMGGFIPLGWVAHLMIGTLLALGYAWIQDQLPGPGIVRGMIYGLAPWLVAQVAVMPLMGMGFFSGSFQIALGSLIGHVVYGAVVGSIYSGLLKVEAPKAQGSKCTSCAC